MIDEYPFWRFYDHVGTVQGFGLLRRKADVSLHHFAYGIMDLQSQRTADDTINVPTVFGEGAATIRARYYYQSRAAFRDADFDTALAALQLLGCAS